VTRALAVFLLLAIGCGDCRDSPEPEEAAEAPEAETPLAPATIARPEGLTLELCTMASRARLHAALGAPGALPAADAREVVRPLAPELADAVAPDAAYCELTLGDERVVAVDGAPEGRGEPGGPGGGRWLGETRARVGDTLVVGTSRAAVERAGAYAARVALGDRAAENDEDAAVQLVVPGRFLTGELRDDARTTAAEWERHGRVNIAREASRHAEPPELGDPTAALVRVAELLGLGVEALGDVGDLRARVRAGERTVDAEVHLAVTPGSALAERMGTWPSAPAELSTLPRGTALAYFRAGLADGEDTLTESLVAIAGDRLRPTEREALEAVSDAVRARPRTLAIGGTEHGGFALWRSRGADLAAVAAPLRAAFGRGYLATLAATATGCADAGARLAGRPARCPEAPVSALRGSTFVVAPAGDPLLLDDGAADEALAALADAEPVVAAWVLVPSSLPAAARLVAPLGALGEVPGSGALVVTLRTTSGGLALRLRGTTDALGTLLALIG